MDNNDKTNKFLNYADTYGSYKKDIVKELIEYEYDFANIGTILIVDIVEYICNNDNYIELLKNLEKNVYIHIAEKYNMNIKTLKSDIAKATNKMHETRCLKFPEEEKSKKTTKTIINSIVNKIKCYELSNQKVLN